MAQTTAPLTYDDYARLPADRRWEVIGGVAYVVPAPSVDHQRAAARMFKQIDKFLVERGGGEVLFSPLDVVLDTGEIVQPDVVFVSDVDAAVFTRKNIQGPPTWAIEVVSDPVRDKLVKRELYERYGVSEYWAIDLDLKTIEVYRPGELPIVWHSGERAESFVLPGLEVPVDDVISG